MTLKREKAGYISEQKIESFSVQGDGIIYYAKTGEETVTVSSAGKFERREMAIMTESAIKPKAGETVTIKHGKNILFKMEKFKPEEETK